MESPSPLTHVRFVVQLPEETVIVYVPRIPFFEKTKFLRAYDAKQMPWPPTYDIGATQIEMSKPSSTPTKYVYEPPSGWRYQY
ncbi:MAG: hypothetical protein KF812_10240 [Fimbriimonadaceae bacterium]|nr:hypothetical protein [Fimbriimonadaceae bacterium]